MEAEEDKMLEHAKEAVHSLTDKKKSWSKKIGGFLWEILIIVIAVNLTIWFHNWNDKRHERQLEKEFLFDIRKNLIADAAKINFVINYHKNGPLTYCDSVLSQINRNKLNVKYIDSNSVQLAVNTWLIFDYGVFQSFNSAGNLRLVENRKLSSDIVSLYSAQLPFIEKLWYDIYLGSLRNFDKYIGNKIGFDGKLSTIIHQPEVKYQIQRESIMLKSLIGQNEDLNNRINTVIQEIDKELKDKFDYTIKTE